MSHPILEAAKKRILIIDGAMGTMIQKEKFDEEGFVGHGGCGCHIHSDLPQSGNNDLLSLTQPDIIERIHRQYLEAGRRHRRDEHVQRPPRSPRPTTGWRTASTTSTSARAQVARRAADAVTANEPEQAALRRRRHRADQPHAVDLARRQRPRLPRASRSRRW